MSTVGNSAVTSILSSRLPTLISTPTLATMSEEMVILSRRAVENPVSVNDTL